MDWLPHIFQQNSSLGFKPYEKNILFSMECVSVTGVEGRFFLFFFSPTKCMTTYQTDRLDILQEEKVAHMDTIEFHSFQYGKWIRRNTTQNTVSALNGNVWHSKHHEKLRVIFLRIIHFIFLMDSVSQFSFSYSRNKYKS